jgi:hypothetical protein
MATDHKRAESDLVNGYCSTEIKRERNPLGDGSHNISSARGGGSWDWAGTRGGCEEALSMEIDRERLRWIEGGAGRMGEIGRNRGESGGGEGRYRETEISRTREMR